MRDTLGTCAAGLVFTAAVGWIAGWLPVLIAGVLIAAVLSLDAVMPTIRFAISKREYRAERRLDAEEAQRREDAYQDWAQRNAE